MTEVIADDLDYVTARIHGRRSRMAEAQRLESLCRLRSVAELSLAVYPGVPALSITRLQQRLVEDLVWELKGVIDCVPMPGAALLNWMIVQLELENLKVLVRNLATRQPLDEHLLIRIHNPRVVNAAALISAASVDELAQRLPQGPFRAALEVNANRPATFFVEAALDNAYFSQLLQRLAGQSTEDRESVSPAILQEVDLWQAMLALRGRFTLGLSADLLMPFYVEDAGLSRRAFADLLRAPELAIAASQLVGKVVDNMPTPVELGAVEGAGWKRLLRLANQAFRRGPVGLGAVVGYASLRRVEVANLITISEGIRAGMRSEDLRARLIT